MTLRKNLALGAVALLLFTLILSTGCGSKAPQLKGIPQHRFEGDYPIKVVATTGMVADLVRNVGGPYVEVEQLMGDGVDPHLYKAPPGDISKLQSADAVFYSGRNLEGKMSDLFVRMARKKPTFAVSDYIEEENILEDEDKHYDPHLWFDVALWSKAVGVVRDVLSEFDPKHADEYKRNAGSYQARLLALHEWCKTEIAKVPRQQRVLVTAHDAFRYFGKAYDIEVKGIQGISTEDEASLKRINELVQFIANRNIKAIFIETSVPKKNIEALIQGCEKGRNHKVVVGGELFSDAMGAPGTPEGTYEGMIRHNVNTIVQALK